MKTKMIMFLVVFAINKTEAQIWNSNTKMSMLLPNTILDTIFLDKTSLTINYLELSKSDTILRGWEHINLKTGIPIDRCWISNDDKHSTTVMFWPNGNALMIKENITGLQNRNTFFYNYDKNGICGKHFIFDEKGDLERCSIYKKDKLKKIIFQKEN